MADDDDVARFHALVQDALAGVFLTITDDCGTGEFEDGVVDAVGRRRGQCILEFLGRRDTELCAEGRDAGA